MDFLRFYYSKVMRHMILVMALLFAHRALAQVKVGSNASRLRSFYSWYITVNDGGAHEGKLVNDSLKKHCTADFLKRMHGNKSLESDPVLHCQDFDKGWVETLSVTKLPAGEKEKYAVCFTEENPAAKHCLNVFLLKEGGEWKIDKVSE